MAILFGHGVRNADRPDLHERLQHSRGAAVFHNAAVNHAVNVHTGDFHLLSCRFHPEPYALMSTAYRHASYDPFAFGNLLLDRQMKIGVGSAAAKHMFLRPFNSDGICGVVIHLYVVGEVR